MQGPFSASFFRRLQQLKIHTRRAFLGSRQGSHVSLRKGHGLEFSDFRAYAPGDDFRHIDWGVYGRTDRLYVRQFREEQDLQVSILVDASRSMEFPQSAGKFEFAKNLALSLAYIALTDGDSVLISPLGQHSSPRYIGPRSVQSAYKFLHELRASEEFSLAAAIRAGVQRQKMPGKCFLISDFLYEPEEIFQTLELLRARSFEIVLLHVLAPEELRLELPSELRVIDSETGEELELSLDGSSRKDYARLITQHTRSIEDYALRHEINYLLLSSTEEIPDVVLNKFPLAGIVG